MVVFDIDRAPHAFARLAFPGSGKAQNPKRHLRALNDNVANNETQRVSVHTIATLTTWSWLEGADLKVNQGVFEEGPDVVSSPNPISLATSTG